VRKRLKTKDGSAKKSDKREKECARKRKCGTYRTDAENAEGKKIVDGQRGRVTPGGNADGYQNKGLAGKAIRNNMKTKGGKIDST
jgi:hypothetical protein